MEETVRFLLSIWTFVTGVLRVVCLWLWNLRWWQFWLMMAMLTGAWIVYTTRKRRREEAWLSEEYAEYEAYRREVPRRFLPFVW